MDEKLIISKVNEHLHSATKELCSWLEQMLPRVSNDWWQECVINNLSFAQQQMAESKGFEKLSDFDLAALLRIANKSWYDMREFAYLPTSQRECVREMTKVRNNWAHCAGEIPDKDVVIKNLYVILEFFETVIITNVYSEDIKDLITAVESSDFSAINEKRETDNSIQTAPETSASELADISVGDRVILTGDPDKRGMVAAISDINGIVKYDVFIDGDLKPFYEGQIQKMDLTPSYSWIDLDTFKSTLTAYEINKPSAGNLYSLNSARIDFVPYQFRPALKMIKADEPRILIADSVGVGKTIEAGLIIKELEARRELDNIAIICPKPLITERKWELEMKRFDEDFIPLNGQELRQIISDTHRDQEWPSRYNKVIIPYSILDSRAYEGDEEGKSYGLQSLDPAPHFDLVIIDEAHHIRNGSLEKEKAFAYKCTRFFCEHADAVVMLTATPLQTSDDDLYTLLNLLRPDVVMDKEVFGMMSRPNEFIYRCSHIIRGAADNWEQKAAEELKNITSTQWGENVVSRNPLYLESLETLHKPEISRDERVKLISDVESLHSFNTMLNRTRRRDIQDFCIRRSHTIKTEFTPMQEYLHNEILNFERQALSKLHDPRCVSFMMSMIRRQAASCIHGLAPYVKEIINRRIVQITDNPDADVDEYIMSVQDAADLQLLAQSILTAAEELTDEDPKFDSVVKVIEEKQKLENNKIILFSTFRHTLAYVHRRLKDLGYRVEQIDGSVKDEDRRRYRERFEMDKSDPNAIDILLFTEVGSEGLDYQFCDTMINYDLPWNPMRIEQRIGRIDRRGQQSEVVHIYNVVTEGTVDADIYERCLLRIGIFERSIGECEEVLGEIGAQIEQIALNMELTEQEKREKFEQMADNEIRRMHELVKLEDEERALFGFDLSNFTATKEIKEAESPWLSPKNIQHLVERYLNERIGEAPYIVGNSDLKQIRLNKLARMDLLEDFRNLSNIRSSSKRAWESFLKGNEPMHPLTFVPEIASKENKAFFITSTHPLVKQAAKYFASNETAHIHIGYYSEDIPEGVYPFSIYAWNYVGMHPKFKIVPLCENQLVSDELTDILQDASTLTSEVNVDKKKWEALEGEHVKLWHAEKEKYIEEVRQLANYRLESIGGNYRSRKRNLEQKINDASDSKIVRMYQSELDSATENYNTKVAQINERMTRADIHTEPVANGIIEIIRG